MSNELDLQKHAAAARALIEALAGGDDEIAESLTEGETEFFEVVDIVLEKMAEDEALVVGIKELIGRLEVRKKAAEGRVKWRRGSLEIAFLHAGLTGSFRRPAATLGVKQAPPSLGDLDEAEIPSTYFEPQDPKLDKKKLLADLKDGAEIPGASLKPGANTIQIRRV